MFYAHSGLGSLEEDGEPLPDHLWLVGELAGSRAAKFGFQAAGAAGGRCHDIGKACVEGAARLSGAAPSYDHSSAGAAYVAGSVKPEMIGKLLAYSVAGHHTGLADGSRSARSVRRTPLTERLAVGNARLSEPLRHLGALSFDLPVAVDLPAGFAPRRQGSVGFTLSFLGRMLFSTIVDADFVATESFYAKLRGEPVPRGGFPDLETLRARLAARMAALEAQARDTTVNRVRSGILAACVKAASASPPGCFTLTVPTGGGKTLASASFALAHAVAHGLDRVVVVVPYVSIIEQTASALRAALGPELEHAVVEHHGSVEPSDVPEGERKRSLAAENWDAPIIVTTAVQFFESLFAARPSRCRKLHNLARAVVVLDEAQSIPVPLLRPSVAALDELTRNYGTTIVLATATQPAVLDRPRDGFEGLSGAVELCPDVPGTFETLRRVSVVHAGQLDDRELAARLRLADRALVIVNTRKHARQLFGLLRDLPWAVHLSGSMCGAHRSAVISEIKRRLAAGERCLVVSTSLIEAGVDVDFPVVYRAEDGLDRIAQAAGRCNREGLLDGLGTLIVFAVSKDRQRAGPTTETDVARSVMRRHAGEPHSGPLGPKAIEEYFRTLYWAGGPSSLDGNGIMPLLEAGVQDCNYPFESVERLYKMIPDDSVPVIVPGYGFHEALASLGLEPSALAVSRIAGRHTVALRRRAFEGIAGVIGYVDESLFGTQFPILADLGTYDSELGLVES